MLGLIGGLIAGVLQLEGMFVILGFFAMMLLISNLYSSRMLNVNDDDFPNNELWMEGLGNASGIFFVSNMTSVT